MNWYNESMKKILVLFLAFVVLSPVFVFAQAETEQEYTLLTQIPGLKSVSTAGDFSSFVNAIYNMSIGIGSVLAVFVIIFAGVRYSMTDAFGTKNDMKERVKYAIGGLVLLLGAYVFLTFVNPDLVDFSNKGLSAVGYKDVKNPVVTDVKNPGVADGSGYRNVSTQFVWTANGDHNFYGDNKECQQATGLVCRQVLNPGYSDFGNDIPVVSPGVLSMHQSNESFHVPLSEDAKRNEPELWSWPTNPYRKPSDFIDCKGNAGGSGYAKIAKSVIEADAYINKKLQEAGYMTDAKGNFTPLTINSSYRSHPKTGGTCVTSGKGTNHPYAFSIDYGHGQLDRQGREIFEALVLATGACRLGFGGAFTHVQWNALNGQSCAESGNRAGSRTYWCYGNARGFYSGRTPAGWAGSCR